jgi:hypothetical protein
MANLNDGAFQETKHMVYADVYFLDAHALYLLCSLPQSSRNAQLQIVLYDSDFIGCHGVTRQKSKNVEVMEIQSLQLPIAGLAYIGRKLCPLRPHGSKI